MNEEQALLDTICANPVDLLPRLVYADWLEERMQTEAQAARAEFIRLQCANYRKPRSDRSMMVDILRKGPTREGFLHHTFTKKTF